MPQAELSGGALSFGDLGLAVALGLLVGLERQWSGKPIAGIRTFPLITVFGTLCAALSERFGPAIVAVGLGATAAFMLVGTWVEARTGKGTAGMTTEVAALVMYIVGAAIPLGLRVQAVVVTGALSVLLYAKGTLSTLVARIGAADLKAIFRLVLIGLVILPVLPDADFGPYRVLNLHEIWAMVVLIVGLSLAAYASYKILDARKGTLVSGVLGGLISSTAATMGFARLARARPGREGPPAIMILVASTVVFARVLIEVAAAAPSNLRALAPPILCLLGFLAALVAWAVFVRRQELETLPQEEPPSDLKSAIAFGLFFAVVLIAVAFARERFGQPGLYGVALLSGLTDVDAITLSTARMVESGGVDPTTGWRAILTGALANLVFKAFLAGAIGGAALVRRVALYFLPAFLFGVGLIFLWP